MPVAGSEVYCKAANKNKDLISEAEKRIRDQQSDIKRIELEIKQRKRDIKHQELNCEAWVKIDETIPLQTNAFDFNKITGGKSRRKKSRKCRKSRKSRKSRRH